MKFQGGKYYSHKGLWDVVMYVTSAYNYPTLQVIWVSKKGREIACDEVVIKNSEEWFECQI